MSIIIGIDPGLVNTGWGIINSQNGKLGYIISGVICTNSKQPLPERLCTIYGKLEDIMKAHNLDVCAIEDSFVNKDPLSSLKLGQARGIAILAAAKLGIRVFEYAPRFVKKAVVGSGKADKSQISKMLTYLLPKALVSNEHEADALAVAICHANSSVIMNKIYSSS